MGTFDLPNLGRPPIMNRDGPYIRVVGLLPVFQAYLIPRRAIAHGSDSERLCPIPVSALPCQQFTISSGRP